LSPSAFVYLGPYVECVCDVVTRASPSIGCPDPACAGRPAGSEAEPGSAGPCVDCGGEVGPATVELRDLVDPRDVVGDELRAVGAGRGGVLYLAPNVHRGVGGRSGARGRSDAWGLGPRGGASPRHACPADLHHESTTGFRPVDAGSVMTRGPGVLTRGEIHVDLRAVDWAAEVSSFEAAFAREIEALRAAYASVVVKWGVHACPS
jgi:hypothetical protein